MSFKQNISSTILAQSRASEEALIGCLLAEAITSQEPLKCTLPAEYFNDGLCAVVYKAIKDISDKGGIADLTTVSQELGAKVKPSDLTNLATSTYSPHNRSRYEFAVKDNYQKLEVEKVLRDMQNDSERDGASLLTYGQKLISLAQNSGGASAKGLDKQDLHSLCDFIATNEGRELYGYSWGDNFKFLDRITKGLRKGKIYRIGAPSNTGKSQMVYTIINNLLKQKARVMFVTLENDIQSTLSYLLSNHQKVSNDDIMEGRVEGDFQYLDDNKENLFILQDTFELGAIFSKVMEFNPDVVILDYIGLMSIKGFNEEAKYTEYAIQVQRFVKATQLAWLDLSNLPTSLQSADEIKINPQFFGSTFLRNNTDVGIHIMPDKEYYALREKVLKESKDIQVRQMFERRSGLVVYVSKNRLGPHSITERYMLDHTRGGEWYKLDDETMQKLQLHGL